jgi:phosphocarrier protein
MSTISKTLTITDPVGIHARPASLFSQAAAESDAKVTLAKGSGNPVEANSILAIMSLGIQHNDTVTITVEAADDSTAESVAHNLIKILTEEQ